MALRYGQRPLALALALCLGAGGLGAALPALASGEPAKSPSFAPDDDLLAALDAKATEFKDQVAAADLQLMVTGTQRLVQAIQQRDLNASRQAWLDTHAVWARCEAFTANLFPGLDKKINGTEDAKTGFHVIEKGLFADTPTVEMAQVVQLAEDMQSYQRVFTQAKFTGYYLIASASTWVFEMGDIVAYGGESPASGNSLADLQHNLDGVERIWKFMFADVIRAKNHFKAEEIDDQIAAVRALLSVPSIDQIPPDLFSAETTKLAAELAAASAMIGWRAPDYTDLGE